MLIAHITDTHITSPGTLLMGIIHTASALERAVAALNRLDPSPDITVLTGDLVESGAPAEYVHLRTLLAPLRTPIFAIPGNHDAREPMRGRSSETGTVAPYRTRYLGAGRRRRGSVF